MKINKEVIIIFALIIIFLSFLNLTNGENSEGVIGQSWFMHGQWLNNSNWDGISYSKINGLNFAIFGNAPVNFSNSSTNNGLNLVGQPIIYNGSVFINQGNALYQLNASNISQQINNFNYDIVNFSSIYFAHPTIGNGYIYLFGGNTSANFLYQLNLSNISQKINSIKVTDICSGYVDTKPETVPILANGYLYLNSISCTSPSLNDTTYTFQLNATNISQQIANYTLETTTHSPMRFKIWQLDSPIYANGYIYTLDGFDKTFTSTKTIIYQLNATNVSQQISNYTYIRGLSMSPSGLVLNDSLYYYMADNTGGVWYGLLLQMNASNLSQLINMANVPTNGRTLSYTPAIAYSNNNFYVGTLDGDFYQVNASNISQTIANISIGHHLSGIQLNQSRIVVISGEYAYLGAQYNELYQVNASNISQVINKVKYAAGIASSPAIGDKYIYQTFQSYPIVGGSASKHDANLYQISLANISAINDLPNITVYSPSSQNYIGGNILINFSATSLSGIIDSLWYYNGATNISYTTANNLTLPEGIYNFIFYASDSLGNINSKNISFNVTIQDITDCRNIIFPGVYTLTQNIHNSGNGACLNITANNVTIYGNGGRISADSNIISGSSGIYASNVNNVSITGFSIINMDKAIVFNDVTNSSVYGNSLGVSEINNNGLLLSGNSSGNTISSNNMSNNYNYGLSLAGTVTNNLLLNNNIYGNNIKDIVDSSSGTNNLVYNNSYGQITWTGTLLNDMSMKGNLALGSGIILANNSAGINSSQFSSGDINSSVNITLNGVDVSSFSNPKMLNYGVVCSICVNYTSLITNPAVFSVAGYGVYSIGDEDFTAPNISIYAPTENTIYTKNSLLINFSAFDSIGVDKLWFNNGNSNISYTNPLYINLNSGSYTFIFYANDTSGNLNSSNLTFTVNIPIVYPSGGGGGGIIHHSNESEKNTYVNFSNSSLGNRYSLYMNNNTSLTFSFHNENYSLTLINVSNNSINLMLENTNLLINLKVGQLVKLNLSSNINYDLLVTLNNIINGQANLSIIHINENMPVKQLTNANKNMLAQFKNYALSVDAIKLILVLFIILIVIIYLFWQKRK